MVTTQRIEYADTARTTPVQIRCKMRTHESLIRPETEKQRFDDGAPSTVPWGFGPQAATGTTKICRVVQDELVAAVWNSLTPAQQAAAPYKYGTSSLVFGPESLSDDRNAVDPRREDRHGRRRNPDHRRSLAQRPGRCQNPIGDRILGAYYCTFVAPEYIRSIFLGGPVV